MSTINWARIAEELTTLNHTIEQATERKDQILELIRANLQPASKTPAGDYTISLSKASETVDLPAVAELYPAEQYPDLYAPRLDAAKVEAIYPPDKFPGIYKPTIQRALVQAEFSPAALRKQGLYKTGTPRVSIK